MVTSFSNSGHGEDSLVIQGGVGRHDLIKEVLDSDVLTNFLEFLLSWGSSLVLFWIRLVTVVVGLDEEPLGGIEIVNGISTFDILFDNSSLVWLSSRDNVVDGSRDSGG